MKDYNATITMLAELAFSRYMGGGNDLFSNTSVYTVAFIYNVSDKTVDADLRNKFDRIKSDYYKNV